MNSRRSFLHKSIIATAGSLLSGKALTQNVTNQELPSLENRKVLFVYGGWDGHEPVKFRDYLVPWMKDEGAEVVTSDTLDPYTDEGLMESIDLVVQIFTMSQITEDQEKGLLKAVKSGAGMAGWHGGMCDAFRTNVEYQFMTGGQWVSHPGGIIDYTVEIEKTEDEVTAGLNGFAMTSEQYYMHIDPNVKVLATTRFNGDHADWIDGCVMPVTWKKYYGNGRIFFTSLGHNLSHVTTVPDAIEMIRRGFKWASASKYAPKESWVSPVYKS